MIIYYLHIYFVHNDYQKYRDYVWLCMVLHWWMDEFPYFEALLNMYYLNMWMIFHMFPTYLQLSFHLLKYLQIRMSGIFMNLNSGCMDMHGIIYMGHILFISFISFEHQLVSWTSNKMNWGPNTMKLSYINAKLNFVLGRWGMKAYEMASDAGDDSWHFRIGG